MITPSHIIYSWALAKKTEPGQGNHKADKKRTAAFVLGALFPDTPTFLFFIVCGLILGYSGEAMWEDMYFNSGWSIPITFSHSFIFWSVLIGVSGYFNWRLVQYFSISALFHAIVDFFVHTEDAYRHFYPLSDWKFHSPVSYWNSGEYGHYVSAADSLLVLSLLWYIYLVTPGRLRYLMIGSAVLYSARLVVEPLLLIYGT